MKAARPLPAELPVGRLAMVARWKPVHLGHAAVLRALMGAGERVWIGVGSANLLDARSPFTFGESAEMIRLVLRDVPPERFDIVPVPDFFDLERWRSELLRRMGPVDLLVTANRAVRDLLCGDVPVLHPVHLVPPEERVALNATMVRLAMAGAGSAQGDGAGGSAGSAGSAECAECAESAECAECAEHAGSADWRAMVPPEVAAWLSARGIPERVARDYGSAIRRIGGG